MASTDAKVDAVGACVGVRGTRIKNIVDELGGERIDIVRWNESLQVLIPNALQPAEIDEVMLCHLLGRAIVLVRDDQLSLAIGRRGQNVRLASKLVGWDIEIVTAEELDEVIEKAVKAFEKIDQVDTGLAVRLVEQGILSYDDLSVMEIADLVNTIEGLSEEQAIEIVARAETLAEELTRRDGVRRRPNRPSARSPRGRPPSSRPRARRRGPMASRWYSSASDRPINESQSSTASPEDSVPSARLTTGDERASQQESGTEWEGPPSTKKGGDRARLQDVAKEAEPVRSADLSPPSQDSDSLTGSIKPGIPVQGRTTTMLLHEPRRSLVRARVIRILDSFVSDHDRGRVLDGGPGIFEGGKPGPIRYADACFYSYDRLPKGPLPDGDLYTAPEIIVELRTREESWHKVLSRVVAYLDAGVLLVCILDIDRRTIRVYSVDHPEQVLSDGHDLNLAPVLDNLCVPVSRLFA